MFKDKVILITGGSSGIGKATALMFAKNEATVAIVYRENKTGADGVVNEIGRLGQKSIAIQANLINENEAKNVIEVTLKEFGKIDVLVNNAGKYIIGDEWGGTSEVWTRSLQSNLISMMNVSKYAVQLFQKQKNGNMVNVASRHGIHGYPDAMAYSAAKAGVINITQIYAGLLAPFGRANSVSPWATKAGYWLTAPKEEVEETILNAPGHKLVEPETIAERILYLASDEAKDITGQNFAIDR